MKKTLHISFVVIVCFNSMYGMEPTSSFTKVSNFAKATMDRSEDRSLFYSGHPAVSVEALCEDRKPVEGRRSEENTQYYFIIQNTTPTQAKKLASFARDNNDPVIAHEVAQWLMLNRNDFVESNEWTDFMNMFIFHLTGNHCLCNCVKNKKLDAVVKIVKDTVYTLKPGEDCSQLLVDQMQQTMHKAEQEFNQLPK